MSKLLWKTLLVSPAVLGATLVVSTGAVRAVDSTSVSSANELNPTETVQPLTAEVESLQPQPIASLTAPTAQQTPGLATQAPVEPAAAQAEVPAQVAITQNQQPLNLASPESEALTPMPSVPATNPTLAQATPSAPADSNVLDQINRYSREGNSNTIDQVTNVNQLSDVSPGDWAYEALQSLVERYGCIAGYPDGTYRGNRALTRYEFAAGLNACLQQVERLIAASVSDFVTREDLETLQRLVQEFETELAALGTRVDDLEGRVAFLEDNQFSTTTKLVGEAIFALTDSFGDIDNNSNLPLGFTATNTDDTNTIFGDRVRLDLQTSFTGQDVLHTRLQAGNLEAFNLSSGSAESTQTFNLFENGNDITLDWLSYTFPFGSSKIYVAAFGGIHSDYVPTLNPYFEDYDGGNGALSTFASESPIYRIGGGAGAAISLGVGPLESILGPSTLTIGYLAGDAANPGEDGGVFNGNYGALAQLNFNLGDRIGIGATYVHAYHDAFSPIFGLG
ncbi:MAG: iron uptake porin, partial [Microcoleus sp. SIO2G3]|nr:iron uptake porin [Microcoleus sp. SIO2G3]